MGRKNQSRSIAMNDEDWAWLLEQAEDQDRSISWIIREMIRIRKEEKEKAS